ncbi:hypothetical protein [Anatilimnocola floriformis]|uniref:hypothetical protein n=1 Tax=Anatilimnocola floriformis TaxID=2948575 RepID=UPI0020C2E2A1|nr:hypothetical protein [Anatilimnocola floriformis]
MAKKKVPVKKVKPTAKKPAAAKSVATKPTKKSPPKKAAAKGKATTAKAAAKATPTKSAASPKSSSPPEVTLGRPLVTQEEKLYMLFHDDYEARQVFEFLRVDTVADLVRLSQEEIVKVLTAPVRRTVQRIRQRLAEKNRSLQGDEDFTRQHKAKLS